MLYRSLSQEHELLEFLTMTYVELFQRSGNVAFYCVQRDMHMVGDLLICPPPGSQHGRRELSGGQVIGNVVSGHGVVNPAPAVRKAVGYIYDALEILRPLSLDNGLQHPAQQSVMLSKPLDEIIRPGDLPCG